MKILILTHLERVAPRLLLEIGTLRREGHQVKVVAWKQSDQEYRHDFPITFISSSSEATFLQSLKRGLLATLAKLARLYPATFKEIKTASPDVVHCGHLSLLPLGILAKALYGCKLVYDSYEFHSVNISAKLGNRAMAGVLKIFLDHVENFFLRWVDGVLTVPSKGEAELRKFSLRLKNVAVLPNVPTLAGAPRKKTFPPPPTAIHIGSLVKEKGLFLMIEAAAIVARDHPDFKLVLIGPLKENHEEVEKLINDLKIADHVVIHGWVAPEALGGYLAPAWVGLAPYQPSEQIFQETIGKARKIFDYMKQGLPVVGPIFGDIARVVVDEDAGLLVDTTKAESLAAAIKQLIEDDGLRARLAANGIKAVRLKYNWELQAEKLKAVYASMFSQS